MYGGLSKIIKHTRKEALNLPEPLCRCYMKYFASSLEPMKAPTNKKMAKTQPETDSEAMLLYSAPMLQPAGKTGAVAHQQAAQGMAATTWRRDLIF